MDGEEVKVRGTGGVKKSGTVPSTEPKAPKITNALSSATDCPLIFPDTIGVVLFFGSTSVASRASVGHDLGTSYRHLKASTVLSRPDLETFQGLLSQIDSQVHDGLIGR
jgi:hypothetical protein